MKKHFAILSILLVTLLSIEVDIARAGDGPVSNDTFANAHPLVIDQGSAGMTTGNIDATKEAGEPNHAENPGGKSLWFKYTPTVTSPIRINTMDTTFDTLLGVYTGSSVNNLQLVGWNDNGSGNLNFGGASTVDLMMVAGTTYYIAVDSFNDNGTVVEGTFKIALLQTDAPFQDNLNGAYDLGVTWRGLSIAGTNYGATMEANEPIATTAVGRGKSVWYRWTSPELMAASIEITDNFDSQIGVYKASTSSPTFAQLTQVTRNLDYTGFTSNHYKVGFRAEAGVTYYIQIDSQGISDEDGLVGNFQMKFGPNRMRYSASFTSAILKSSPSVFRPSEGTWYSLASVDHPVHTVRQWGINGDTPIAADFFGHGTSQLAAIRNQNGQKVWYIGTGQVMQKVFPWGLASDKAVVGDFDRDGIADPVAIRNTPNGFVWYIRRSNDDSLRTFQWGMTGDRPVIGDFDGDRFTDVSIIRNTQNGLIWYLLRSNFDGAPLYTTPTILQFGLGGDLAAAEDYDGDRTTDIAVYRPSTGTWYILRSSDGQVQYMNFGLAGDKPQPADYDGDGKADLGIYRPSNGTWYFWMSGTNTHAAIQWGLPTDIPVASLSTLSH